MLSTKWNTQALATAADLPARLEIALRSGSLVYQRPNRMSPQLSYGRHAGPPPPTARRAAVLLMLFQRNGRWHLPLTERPTALAHHGGQISLPGGAVDVGETSSVAALRELQEELGFNTPVDLLGQLGEYYVFASDFTITPWVGVANCDPAWQPQADEVQAVIELPLELLLDEEAVGQLTIQRGPLEFHAPSICVGDSRIWGATSVVLNDFAEVLRKIGEQLRSEAMKTSVMD